MRFTFKAAISKTSCKPFYPPFASLDILVLDANNSGFILTNLKHFSSQAPDFRHIYIYTGCPRRNVKYFGRVFLELNYTDITQNTYIQI